MTATWALFVISLGNMVVRDFRHEVVDHYPTEVACEVALTTYKVLIGKMVICLPEGLE